ncbi:MAG: NAD(P)H-hydrate dehydratase [Prevotella sp.]|nr:NAD(P)H-hydrate dehydratase [Prevotella sp.]
MKIFTSSQIHELDAYTIEHEPIRSIDLMERAARSLTRVITERWDAQTPVTVFAGPGNNGGDALAVARLLAEQDYQVSIYLFNIHNKLSEDCAANKKRIGESKRIKKFVEVTSNFDPPQLDAGMLVVDGLFGSGLNKPLTGGFASLVKYINQAPAPVVSIDVPSGLMTEDNTYNVKAHIVKATLTLTLQQKKLAMLLDDCQPFLGEVRVLDIRLSQEYIQTAHCQFELIEERDVRRLMLGRHPFAHKGMMGNALLVAGSYGMAGAAVLAARSCMRSGVGKLTVLTPKSNSGILQMSVPEAVLHIDRDETAFSEPISAEGFTAMGIGPGMGTQESTAIAMIAQLRRAQCPVVADADALNMLAVHRAWMQQLPKGIILTPHPKEFDRLVEASAGGCYERLNNARLLAERFQGIVVLKGHHTAICMADGRVVFNSTGNAGMATAGSGDVLTGIITALCARGYKPEHACVVGVYLHGLAGDLAAREVGEESLVASDIINHLPQAFAALNDK